MKTNLILFSLLIIINTAFASFNPNFTKAEQVETIVTEAIPSDKIDASQLNLVIQTDNDLIRNEGTAIHQFLIARDAIIPISAQNNPEIVDLMEQGIPFAYFSNPMENTISYITDDIISHLNFRFNNGIQAEAAGSIENFVAMATKNPTAIGFCYLSDYIRFMEENPTAAIQIIAVDRNGNGKIDAQEDFYSSIESLQHALWVGKYPRILMNNLSLVSYELELSEADINYMSWMLASGKGILAEHGFANPKPHELIAQVKAINPIQTEELAATKDNWAALLLIIIAGIAIAGYVVTLLLSRKAKSFSMANENRNEEFAPQALDTPNGLLYDKTHTWAFLETSGKVKIGLDDFLRKAFGKADKIEFKDINSEIKKGDVLASIHYQGKKVKLIASVSGVITEINKDINSIMGNEDLTSSWIYKIQPANWKRETEFLFMADAYRQWVKQEFNRLREFVASMINQQYMSLETVAYQDGGELKTGFMSEMTPEMWVEFEAEFLK